MVRRWAWVGIVLFVVADAVLIMVALKHTREGAATAPPYTPVVASAPTPSMTPPPTTPTSSGSSPQAATSAPETASTIPTSTAPTSSTPAISTPATQPTSSTSATADLAATVLLDMASDGSAIRATRGSCPADGAGAVSPAVQVSGDAGKTWSPVASTATAVERVAASRGGKSWFVATDEDCTLVEHDSAGDGKDWSTSSPEGAWALPVKVQTTSILAPHGDVEIGCTPVSLAAVDSKSAVVACRDGALRITADSGKTWTGGKRVPGVVGISFVGSNSGFALAASDGCHAQVWRTMDGAASFSKLACLDGTAPQAITAAGSTILVQVDGAMQRSDDEGDTWTKLP